MRIEIEMGTGMEWNNHFIIMFAIIKNGINISFHFYVWYNKII